MSEKGYVMERGLFEKDAGDLKELPPFLGAYMVNRVVENDMHSKNVNNRFETHQVTTRQSRMR